MKRSTLTLGISPCPNDTFIFEEWIHGRVEGAPALNCEFHDVQTLNEMAREAKIDLLKVSCGTMWNYLDKYVPLRAGGAMGWGYGPLLISRAGTEFIPSAGITLPGKETTAALLYHFWLAEKQKEFSWETPVERFAFFDELYRDLQSGKVEQGVVIHESRFTYKQDGLKLVEDLGAYWEQQTNSPVPLGVIMARKELLEQEAGTKGSIALAEVQAQIEAWIRQSLTQARERPQRIGDWMRNLAQIPDDAIIEQHIDAFVTEYSMDWGEEGQTALSLLQKSFEAAALRR
jgi:1,4-dihydroxy-6-naphthoate synthase